MRAPRSLTTLGSKVRRLSTDTASSSGWAWPLFEVTECDEAGAVLGTSQEPVLAPADSTVAASSQGPKNKLVLTTPGLECAEDEFLWSMSAA